MTRMTPITRGRVQEWHEWFINLADAIADERVNGEKRLEAMKKVMSPIHRGKLRCVRLLLLGTLGESFCLLMGSLTCFLPLERRNQDLSRMLIRESKEGIFACDDLPSVCLKLAVHSFAAGCRCFGHT